jgi:hypothetical protein
LGAISGTPIPPSIQSINLGGCETIHFGIRALFDLHLNQVMRQVDIKNAYNSIFKTILLKNYEMLKDFY